MNGMEEINLLLGGGISVHATQHRGATPEELAERALDKIISVGGNTHPAIRDQAEAYRENIRKVLMFYMKEAVRADHVTLAHKLREAGYPELVKIIDM